MAGMERLTPDYLGQIRVFSASCQRQNQIRGEFLGKEDFPDVGPIKYQLGAVVSYWIGVG
jgi:hypothetical protein